MRQSRNRTQTRQQHYSTQAATYTEAAPIIIQVLLCVALHADYGNAADIEDGTFEHTGTARSQDPYTGCQLNTQRNKYVMAVIEVVAPRIDMPHIEKLRWAQPRAQSVGAG